VTPFAGLVEQRVRLAARAGRVETRVRVRESSAQVIRKEEGGREGGIRENPASRGTETSAEVLVGPPWRMESNAA
jgi:hypothetical protein